MSSHNSNSPLPIQTVTEVTDRLLPYLRQPRRRLSAFRSIPASEQGIALFSQSHTTQQAILARLSNAEIINLLNSLDPDHATALIRQLPKLRGSRITSQLSHQIREKVDFLLRFHPKTAAGMMDIDYVIVSPEDTFDTVAKAIRRHDLSTGRPPIVLCVDTGGVLLGELPAHILALKPKTTKVAGWCRKLPNVRFDDDEQKVVNTFVRNPHHKVVVLDDNDSVLGIVHSDDVLAVLDKRTLRDLSSFAGVKNEEDAMDSAITKFRNRWIWLLINLGTAFLAASVVGLFESTISKFTLLAVYMPIVAGMGGNAGTQTMAIAVRGIVLREVELGHGWTFIRREMMAGLMNGILNGLIVASVATFFNRSPILGLVLAIAMVVNLMIAGMFGALIPLIMKTLGKDPAASATIFITTCTDVGGFFVFLSLAKMLL